MGHWPRREETRYILIGGVKQRVKLLSKSVYYTQVTKSLNIGKLAHYSQTHTHTYIDRKRKTYWFSLRRLVGWHLCVCVCVFGYACFFLISSDVLRQRSILPCVVCAANYNTDMMITWFSFSSGAMFSPFSSSGFTSSAVAASVTVLATSPLSASSTLTGSTFSMSSLIGSVVLVDPFVFWLVSS